MKQYYVMNFSAAFGEKQNISYDTRQQTKCRRKFIKKLQSSFKCCKFPYQNCTCLNCLSYYFNTCKKIIMKNQSFPSNFPIFPLNAALVKYSNLIFSNFRDIIFLKFSDHIMHLYSNNFSEKTITRSLIAD